jgi:hypothetical protein
MGQQVCKPNGIGDIGLAAGHVLDVSRIGQDQRDVAIGQDVPNWLPIDARRLHRHVGAASLGQPVQQRQQTGRGGVERTDLGAGRPIDRQANRGDDGIFVNIQSRTTRVENFHGSLHLLRRRRRAPLDQSLNSALPNLAVHGAIGGALDAPGPTNTRARSHHRKADLSADDRKTMPQFHPRWVGRSGEELIRMTNVCRKSN